MNKLQPIVLGLGVLLVAACNSSEEDADPIGAAGADVPAAAEDPTAEDPTAEDPTAETPPEEEAAPIEDSLPEVRYYLVADT